MAKPELGRFAFGPRYFAEAVDTGIPGLMAVYLSGVVMVARRGGAWYEPRGNEAQAAADALSLHYKDQKFVSVDGHAVEDICNDCEKNIRVCQCPEDDFADGVLNLNESEEHEDAAFLAQRKRAEAK